MLPPPPRVIRVMMIAAADGTPVVPESGKKIESFQLAVRPNAGGKYPDVTASSSDDILRAHDPEHPELGEGLSCSAVANEAAFQQRYGKELAFKKNRRVWEIETSVLPNELVVVFQKTDHDPDHYQIEPAVEMTLERFQALLASTRHLWRLVQWNGPKERS